MRTYRTHLSIPESINYFGIISLHGIDTYVATDGITNYIPRCNISMNYTYVHQLKMG